ncbi:MAG: hypothetical protein CSA66_00620 [Proteobacteria bacterium]|nr:MAG: hypothetical protein CSA66_00620 [Pseudomonadota bacterium]
MTDTTRRRSSERTRARILDAAIEVFAERGFAGARVDAIAEAAGSNKRMLYAYFGNKEGLWEAALRRVLEAALAAAAEAAPSALDISVRGRALIRWYLGYLAANPLFVRLVSWATMVADRHAAIAIEDLAHAGLERLDRLVGDGVAAGVLEDLGDRRHVIAAIHGMCLGFFHRRALLEQLWGADLTAPATVEALADVVERLVFDGLAATTEPQP